MRTGNERGAGSGGELEEGEGRTPREIAPDHGLTPPAEVLAEIRRRQRDGPEAGVPLDEAFDHIRKVLADER